MWARLTFENIQLKQGDVRKILDMACSVIMSFINANIIVQSNPTLIQSELRGEESDDPIDEEEDFTKAEELQDEDDVYHFTKLMAQRLQFSLQIIYDKLDQVIREYERLGEEILVLNHPMTEQHLVQ